MTPHILEGWQQVVGCLRDNGVTGDPGRAEAVEDSASELRKTGPVYRLHRYPPLP
jgi:hypothetical protein